MTERLSKGYFQWRCRRGTKELDVLLCRFLEASYSDLSDDELIDFKEFLEVQDTDLWSWLTSQETPKDKFNRHWVKRIIQA